MRKFRVHVSAISRARGIAVFWLMVAGRPRAITRRRALIVVFAIGNA